MAPTSEQKALVQNEIAHAIELHQTGEFAAAAEIYRQILERHPNHADALHLLGVCAYQLGNFEEAVKLILTAIPLLPGFVEAYINLGYVYRDSGRLAESVASFQKALEVQPDNAVALLGLGNTYRDKMEPGKAQECFRRALQIRPDYTVAHSNLLMLLQYDPAQTPATLADAHKEWDRRHGQIAPVFSQNSNLQTPDRLLRIGYLSPDFRRHPVGFFLLQMLPYLNRDQVTTYCYHDSFVTDDITGQLKVSSDVWRTVARMNHQELATQIRADKIDILVDLAGHTAKNRLPVFALKPAPVQATWAGYTGTTGLSAMDYLISDSYETPVGVDQWYVERIMRLPDAYVCYSPPEYAPQVNALPAVRTGKITFGCFNNLLKINDGVVSLWAKLLGELPDARLLMIAQQFHDPEMVKIYQQKFAKEVAGRVEFRGSLPHKQLLECYNEIDIALDPFPYSGGLTTLESLWMGVPVVALAGKTFAGRHSVSHLTVAGLPEMIADSPEAYLRIARELAGDLHRLTSIRAGLRDRMKVSPLCDGRRFAGNLESAFRKMWIDWCNKQDRIRGVMDYDSPFPGAQPVHKSGTRRPVQTDRRVENQTEERH